MFLLYRITPETPPGSLVTYWSWLVDKGTRGVSYRVFRKLEKNETTVIFVDPAEGGDYSAMTAMSKKYLDAFMTYHSKTAETAADIGSASLGNEANKMGKYIYIRTGLYPWIAVERNKGQATIARLLELEYPNLFKMKTFDLQEQKESEHFGWDTNKKTRPKMLDEWAEALIKREAIVYDEDTLREHLSFIRPEKTPTHPEAITGKNDDRVIACAGAWQVVQLVQREKPKGSITTVQAWDDDFGRVYR